MKRYYMQVEDKVLVYPSIKARREAFSTYNNAKIVNRAEAFKVVKTSLYNAFLYEKDGIEYLCNAKDFNESMGNIIGYLDYQ